jgi:hypothetical protein
MIIMLTLVLYFIAEATISNLGQASLIAEIATGSVSGISIIWQVVATWEIIFIISGAVVTFVFRRDSVKGNLLYILVVIGAWFFMAIFCASRLTGISGFTLTFETFMLSHALYTAYVVRSAEGFMLLFGIAMAAFTFTINNASGIDEVTIKISG